MLADQAGALKRLKVAGRHGRPRAQRAASLASEIPLAVAAHIADPRLPRMLHHTCLPARPMRLARPTRLSFARTSRSAHHPAATPANDDELSRPRASDVRSRTQVVQPAQASEPGGGSGSMPPLPVSFVVSHFAQRTTTQWPCPATGCGRPHSPPQWGQPSNSSPSARVTVENRSPTADAGNAPVPGQHEGSRTTPTGRDRALCAAMSAAGS